MFRKEQKKLGGLPKELQKVAPLLGLVPLPVIEKQFKKVWKKKTKCLDDPEKNKKKIQKLQTEQTKKIKYKEKTVHDWLEEIKTGQTNKETKTFIQWYKTEYYKISLKDLGIFK